MKCPHCNQEHDADALFCPRTGKRIENSMKACSNPDCLKFGMYVLSSDCEYCPKCGKPLSKEGQIENINDNFERKTDSQASMWCKRYDKIGGFEDGFAEVELDGEYGLVNSIGEEIIPLTDKYIQYMGHGYVKMANFSDDTEGVKDTNGRVILPCKYDDMSIWYDDDTETFSVGLKNKYGVANKNGGIVIPIEWDRLSDFYQSLAVAKKDNAHYLINTHGEIVFEFPQAYSDVKQLYNGLYGVKKGNKWGCVDDEGVIYFDFVFDSVDYGWEDCFVMEKNRKFGMRDKNGNEIVPCSYERQVIHLKEKIALFQRMDGYWDLYHMENHKMIPGHYEKIQRISSDGKYFTYCDGDFCGLADENGNIIIAPENYKILLPPVEGLCYAVFYDEDEAEWHKEDENFSESDYELYGMVNLDGEEVIPCIYEGINEPYHGLVVANFKGTYCIIDTSNNMIFANGVNLSEWKEANGF